MKQIKMLLLASLITIFTTYSNANTVNMAPIISYLLSDTVTTQPPCITCWGDSLTVGTGGGGTIYSSVLASLSGLTVDNCGVRGEDSVTICARSGTNPFLVNVEGGIIPASGDVRITFEPIDGIVPRPLLDNNDAGEPGGDFSGILGENVDALAGGIAGRITYETDAGEYTFTRLVSGTEIIANEPMSYHSNWVRENTEDTIWILWLGQNGPSDARAVQDMKAMTEKVGLGTDKWFVINRPTSNDEFDTIMFAEFGDRFIPIRKYLIENGLEDAGITPTAQDLIDIDNGTVPTSLRSDGVHFNAAGYTVLGKLVYRKLQEYSWIDGK